jgi:hypothetical protein
MFTKVGVHGSVETLQVSRFSFVKNPLEHVIAKLHVVGYFLFDAERFAMTQESIRLRVVFKLHEIGDEGYLPCENAR